MHINGLHYIYLHVHGSVDSILPYRHSNYLDTDFSFTVQKLFQAVVLLKSTPFCSLTDL